ncbi:UNVERIFIED_CONTAM: hypothetical protein HDU68_001073 [Siphonaria sp. JEL0065]|nr:hypothetical protein HDU68_001073 [Siphonaria sp. JEL0065]
MKFLTLAATILFASQAVVAGPIAVNPNFEEWTVAQLSTAMNAGTVTSAQLTQYYLDRIAKYNPTLHAVIETNPDALKIAAEADKTRKHCKKDKSCDPLLGIPVLVKDNIASRDHMQTTAGSWALYGSVVPRDSFVVKKLRKAGAVLLGKANLSEFANLRSAATMPSGWSGRGGQTINPYNATAFVCGSSSGSAVAASANLAAITLGSETDGSIICPSAFNGIVGLKTTVGLVSRAGVIPISHVQDTVGPMVRTVADAAYVLDVISGTDERDSATKHADKKKPKHPYSSYLKKGVSGDLAGVRIGIDLGMADSNVNASVLVLKSLGATIVPVTFPQIDLDQGATEVTILFTDFKADLNKYLSGLDHNPIKNLATLINVTAADPRENVYGWEDWVSCEATKGQKDPAYLEAVKNQTEHVKILDAFYAANKLDVFFGQPLDFTGTQIDMSHTAALAGYPVITVPSPTSAEELVASGGLPNFVGFTGLAYSEPALVKAASAFEQATKGRVKPPLA